jgi:cation/acetate symporter
MPIAFLLAYIFSKSDSSVRASQEIEAFEDQYVRAQTGFGASGAAKH